MTIMTIDNGDNAFHAVMPRWDDVSRLVKVPQITILPFITSYRVVRIVKTC